jgi:hypothetical protein
LQENTMKKQRSDRRSRRQARRARRRHQQRTRRREPDHPIVMTFGYDGAAAEADCTCPICAELALAGVSSYTMGPDGELVELRGAPPPAMIEVTVRGTPSTWPHLPADGRRVSIPAGTIVADLLEYLAFRDRDLRVAFPPGSLRATLDGQPCDPAQVVRPGDDLSVSGIRDPALSRLMARLLD